MFSLLGSLVFPLSAKCYGMVPCMVSMPIVLYSLYVSYTRKRHPRLARCESLPDVGPSSHEHQTTAGSPEDLTDWINPAWERLRESTAGTDWRANIPRSGVPRALS